MMYERLYWKQLGTTLLALLFTVGLCAQSSPTGTVTGRILNPATQQYVRNAEIRVEGTGVMTTSDDDGNYTLPNVPGGERNLVVSYSGYDNTVQPVTVLPGQTIRQELSLTPFGAQRKTGDTVVLEKFVVSSQVEGNAKQIMERRNSMSLGTSIASDVFGDVTEGNVGEFLKYLPGIELETVEADTRGPRLGGMDPQYTGVSVDGMKSASADGFGIYSGTENGSAGSNTRAFSFEQVSINSIESISIYRITPPELDGDAPAGTINMKSKRAFDTKGRRIAWSASTGFNSEEFTLRRTSGPGDSIGHKFRPTYSLNYSDSFFNNRLGVLFGFSESNLYNEQQRVQNNYGTGTATSAGVPVVSSIVLKDGPKWTERNTATFTVDYKATDNLVLSLTAINSFYEMFAYNRQTTLTTGTNQLAGSGYTTINTAAAGANISNGGGNINKLTRGVTVVPKFEFKWNAWTIDGAYSVSASKNTYGIYRRASVGNAQVNNLTGLTVTATRPDAESSAWTITQTGGNDWTDLFNYKNPRITDDVRYVYNQVDNAQLNAKWVTPLAHPTFIKFGVKRQERTVYSSRTGGLYNYSYVGPGGGTTGSYAGFTTPFVFDPSALGVVLRSVTGKPGLAYANRDQLGELFVAHPEQFVRSVTTANYFAASFGDQKRIKEKIAAAYAMATSRIGPWTVQGGLRMERTETAAEEFDPLPASQVLAAGFPVSTATGQATTVSGLDYQYRTKPKAIRKGTYDNYFPSISAKYRFSDNLIGDIGAGKAILRPYVNDLTGLYSIDEVNETITASNSKLKPELSDRIAASMSYYLPNAGILTGAVTQTQVKNFTEVTQVSAADFGITDPLYANYDVITKKQGGGRRTFRSLELEYRQQLRFLPGFLANTTVNANYTRTTVSQRSVGVTPNQLKGGFNMQIGRVGFGLQAVWLDDAPWITNTSTNTTLRFRKANLKMDGDVNIRLGNSLRLFVQVRNIGNVSHRIYDEATGALYKAENYGGNWVFGVRGSF